MLGDDLSLLFKLVCQPLVLGLQGQQVLPVLVQRLFKSANLLMLLIEVLAELSFDPPQTLPLMHDI